MLQYKCKYLIHTQIIVYTSSKCIILNSYTVNQLSLSLFIQIQSQVNQI